MEFDLDYEPASWDGERKTVSERGIEIIKAILRSDLDEFSERQVAVLMGTKKVRLDQLWKAGVLKRYEATKPSTRPQRIYSLDLQGILYNLSGDPEIRGFLQERAQRQQPVVQTDCRGSGNIAGDRCFSHRPLTQGWPR